MSDGYIDTGVKFGVAAGIITFVVSYIYCIAAYGFLFGLGLGWLPSAILAVIVGMVTVFTWPVLLIFFFGVLLIILSATHH